MYKFSIWLKGGGKIVEECDLSSKDVSDIYWRVSSADTGIVKIARKEGDKFPIALHCSEIAAVQIDEKYVPDNSSHTRKLETRV